MRSPVQVWSAAPLKNTTKTSCFFNVCNVFCTHLHNFFEIVRGACRLRSMPFLASNPSSSLAVSSSLNIVSSRRNFVFFLMCAMFFAHICTISLKLCVAPVVCARRLRILRALIAFSCRLNYPAKLHAATACRFLCAFRTPLQKLCRRVRRLRSRLPLASNFSLFTCRQQLYGLFCHRSLSAAVLFVLVFST